MYNYLLVVFLIVTTISFSNQRSARLLAAARCMLDACAVVTRRRACATAINFAPLNV
jgi:hypothetical protein